MDRSFNNLTVSTSSSLPRLAEALALSLSENPAPPLSPETIVTLSTGMARWLSMELAVSNGVSAGLAFRFPNDILDDCFQALLPDIPGSLSFTRDAMGWRIAALLPALLKRPGFEAVAGYLGDRSDERRLLQFSRQLADLFDQYTIFRPGMILEWDAGAKEGWQADLWRALNAAGAGMHRAARLQLFRQRIRAGVIPPDSLPHRISLFGISYLPPFHLEAFSLLSGLVEVTFYLQNPCGAYWGDILSQKRLAGITARQGELGEVPEYYETGNPLLSSLGGMGQEFHDLLLEYGFETLDLDETGRDRAAASDVSGSLLGAIQADIRALRDRGGKDPKVAVPAVDHSVQIHSCHGPLREMEILYDNLLAQFDELNGLEPRDILVMTPDIERYAPYISAVFGAQPPVGRPALPFTIADRSRRCASPVIDVFLKVLEIPSGRFGVNQILELLEAPPVAARFTLSPDELETIRDWLGAVRVRWGLDERHRSELGFPAFGDFSWRAGLDRLFLGYALAPGNDRLFEGILPFGDIEGRMALPLGKLAGFIRTMEAMGRRLAGKQTLSSWADTLTDAASSLIREDADEGGLKELFSALQQLRDAGEQAGFNDAVGLDAVRDCLASLLSESGGGHGFLGGRITFCATLPMRSIPFRVICLAGMNDGLFPRTKRQPGFSMMAGTRKRGDRSLRDEDRYLFLETLMSARDRLLISYTGQSDRDNSLIPPSVVAAELLDYVERGFFVEGTVSTVPDIVTRHRLQAFSTEYFSGEETSRLFSYSRENRDAVAARLSGLRDGQNVRDAQSTGLPDDPALWRELDIMRLVRFLANPSAAFLAQRLDVYPRDPEEELAEREPFALESLDGYGLRQELVRYALENRDGADLFKAARARSLLPPLTAGRIAFDEARRECETFARRVAPQLGEGLEPLSMAFELEGTRLSGILADMRAGQHLRWRCAGLRGKDRLSLWVEHLLLNYLRPVGYPRNSRFIAKDRTFTLAPLDRAGVILADLLELYREGLRRPLRFFPQSAWLYLTDGIEKAEGRWSGTDHSPAPAESADPAFALCFGEGDALNEEFVCLAERIYGPLRAAAVEEKVK